MWMYGWNIDELFGHSSFLGRRPFPLTDLKTTLLVKHWEPLVCAAACVEIVFTDTSLSISLFFLSFFRSVHFAPPPLSVPFSLHLCVFLAPLSLVFYLILPTLCTIVLSFLDAEEPCIKGPHNMPGNLWQNQCGTNWDASRPSDKTQQMNVVLAAPIQQKPLNTAALLVCCLV